uniref:Pancreatic lipase-related protein 2 n=2 Tax=Aceria tosichella TaxID=561515 RepID=A0A6G1SKN8_9ACAR
MPLIISSIIPLLTLCAILLSSQFSITLAQAIENHDQDTDGYSTTSSPRSCDNDLVQFIEPFEDDLLPREQLTGDFQPGLGRVMMLTTYLGPMSTREMLTSFSIHTNSMSVPKITFKPPPKSPPSSPSSSWWSLASKPSSKPSSPSSSRRSSRPSSPPSPRLSSPPSSRHSSPPSSPRSSAPSSPNRDGDRTSLDCLTIENDIGYHYDLKRMAESDFDPNKRTIIMIPGYLSTETISWVRDATTGWLELHNGGKDGDGASGGVNVITVDWSASNHGFYSQAVSHTTMVARQVTIFLYYLYRVKGADIFRDKEMLDNLHLVGHSLGAHIAAFVGQDLGGLVGRITGLDPAGPSFDQVPNQQRLDRTDAKLVEVLHTNGGKLRYVKSILNAPGEYLASIWRGSGITCIACGLATGTEPRAAGSESTAWFGINEQVGHVDYYANDGSEQPGCLSKLHICDHNRATEIYVDLLRYQLALRSSADLDQALIRRNDAGSLLMAFRADSYDEFEAGKSFEKECGDFLATSEHLNGNRQSLLRKKCAIPLFDFMRPSNELIHELATTYGVNFEPGTKPDTLPQYYFKTSAGAFLGASKNQLVGDHYMLRIYLGGNLDSEHFRWREPAANESNWCSLRIKMTMANGEQGVMVLGHLKPSQVKLVADRGDGSSSAEHYILAIPFVHPSGSEARLQLERLLAIVAEEERVREKEIGKKRKRKGLSSEDPGEEWPARLASAEFSSVFKQLMPRTIVLSVSESKPGSEPGSICQLDVKALEVHPIDGRSQSIGALYGYRLAFGQQLPIMTSSELVEQLVATMFFTNRLTSSKNWNSFTSFGAGLEAAMVHG